MGCNSVQQGHQSGKSSVETMWADFCSPRELFASKHLRLLKCDLSIEQNLLKGKVLFFDYRLSKYSDALTHHVVSYTH